MSTRQRRSLQVDSVKQGVVIGCLMCVGFGLLGMSFASWPLSVNSPLFFGTLILSIISVSQRRLVDGNVLLVCFLAVPFCGCTQSAGGPPSPSNSVDQRPVIDDHKVETSPTEIARPPGGAVQPSTKPMSSPIEQRPVSNTTVNAKSRPSVVIPDAPDMRRPTDSKIETRTHWDDAGRYFFEYPAQWQVVEAQDQVVLTSVPNSECSVSVDFHSPGRGIAPADYGFKDTAAGVCQVYMRDAVQNGRPTRGPLELKIPGADDAAWAAWEWNESITELVIFRVNGDYKKLELHYLAAASPIRTQAVTPLQTLRIKNRNTKVAMDPAVRNPPQPAQTLPQSGAAEEGYVAPSPSFSKHPPAAPSAGGLPRGQVPPVRTYVAPSSTGANVAAVTPERPRGKIGVEVFDHVPNRQDPARKNNEVWVLRVATGSPADDAGLWVEAVITKVDGEIVKNVAEFNACMARKLAGDDVVVTVKLEENGSFCRARWDLWRTRLDWGDSDMRRMLPHQNERIANSAGDIRVKVVSIDTQFSTTPRPEGEKDAIEEVEDRGGTILHDNPRPGSSVIAVKFQGHQLSDASFQYLRGLQELTTFRICNGFPHQKFTVTGLSELQHFPRLRTLHLVNGTVDGAWMKAIHDFRHLTVLSLAGCKLSTDAMLALEKLARLQTLSLRDTSVTDEEIKSLANLNQLQALDLVGTKTTGAALVHLKALTDLECLDLSGIPVSDESAQHLAGLTKLRHLNLSDSRITDRGLEHLRNLKMLDTLILDSSRPSGITLEGLRQHLGELSLLRKLHVRGPNFEPGEVRQLGKLWPKAEIVTSIKTVKPTATE